MKKISSWLFVFTAMFVLVGCGSTPEKAETPASTTTQSKVEKQSFELTLKVDGKEVSSETVPFEEGQFLQDVLLEVKDIKQDSNGLISEIEGHANDEKAQKYWMYYVNGDMPDVGAAEYELKDGDKIEWKLEEMTLEE